jgi:RNA polymerase-binding transcription factor DksA
MHYHYFTLEQREALEGLIRASLAGRPGMDDALKRLHSPAFGVCEACGGDIPYRKLAADPLAARCPACRA